MVGIVETGFISDAKLEAGGSGRNKAGRDEAGRALGRNIGQDKAGQVTAGAHEGDKVVGQVSGKWSASVQPGRGEQVSKGKRGPVKAKTGAKEPASQGVKNKVHSPSKI